MKTKLKDFILMDLIEEVLKKEGFYHLDIGLMKPIIIIRLLKL